MADAQQDPPQEVHIIQGPPAKKLLKLVKRVAARKGSAVGLMASVGDLLAAGCSIFRRAALDNAFITAQEVHLLTAFTKRIQRRCAELAVQKVSGMDELARVLEQALRQLEEADRGGYQIKNLQRQAEVDYRTLTRLHTSIKARRNEAAAVLAELEQAVDPLEGMTMVSGRQRKKNETIRKKEAKGRIPLPQGMTQEDLVPGPQLPPVDPNLMKDKAPKTSGFSG